MRDCLFGCLFVRSFACMSVYATCSPDMLLHAFWHACRERKDFRDCRLLLPHGHRGSEGTPLAARARRRDSRIPLGVNQPKGGMFQGFQFESKSEREVLHVKQTSVQSDGLEPSLSLHCCQPLRVQAAIPKNRSLISPGLRHVRDALVSGWIERFRVLVPLL